MTQSKKLAIINTILMILIILLLSFSVFVYLNQKLFFNKPKITNVTKKRKPKISKNQKIKSSQPRPEPNSLMVGQNHNNSAEQYAYDVATVKSYIDGTINKEDKIVFLTFDDGVDLNMTPKILDILKEYQVHATFFIIGNLVNDQTKPILQRQITEGHALGIHSFSHNLSLLYPSRVANAQQIKNEASQSLTAMKSALGEQFSTKVWRYPGGHMSWTNMQDSDNQLQALGLDWIDWNALVGDAEPRPLQPKTSDEMMNHLLTSSQNLPATNVRVILMHDISGKELTMETLPRIIQYYKDQGYQFGVLK